MKNRRGSPGIGMIVLGILIGMPLILMGQVGNWGQFEAAVFQTAEVVGRVITEGGSPSEIEGLQQDVAQLEAQFPAYGQQCPSTDVCESTQYVLMMTQHVLGFPAGGVLSVEDGKKVAFLKQAAIAYRAQDANQTSAAGSAAPAATTAVYQPIQPIPIEVFYAYQPQGKGKLQQLTTGGIMHSGDRYKIIFQTGEPCYVYIFQADSSGKVYGLFPLSEFRSVRLDLQNPVQPGAYQYVPSEQQSFVLDNQTGTENIYFLAFRERDLELEELYEQVVAAQNQTNPHVQQAAKNALLAKVQSKGPAKVVQDSAQPENVAWDGEVYSLARQRLEGMGDGCVDVLTFTHR